METREVANVPIRTMAEVADWHRSPTKAASRPPGGRGRPPKCLARCFRAGCWAGTEDVPDCHLPRKEDGVRPWDQKRLF